MDAVLPALLRHVRRGATAVAAAAAVQWCAAPGAAAVSAGGLMAVMREDLLLVVVHAWSGGDHHHPPAAVVGCHHPGHMMTRASCDVGRRQAGPCHLRAGTVRHPGVARHNWGRIPRGCVTVAHHLHTCEEQPPHIAALRHTHAPAHKSAMFVPCCLLSAALAGWLAGWLHLMLDRLD